MEKLFKGADITGESYAHGKGANCDFAIIVKKGHSECGDSAFLYSDREMLAAAVLDGVSGEPGAAFASSDAASAILARLKCASKPNESAMKEALISAHLAIRIGYTTATILHLAKDGSFIIASVGDSPIYSIDAGGKMSLELPLDRAVKDGDSILKYFHYRNMVTSVLGGQMELKAHICTGRLKKGEALILATDGVSDNLYVRTKDGYVSDSSGIGDASGIIGKAREPREILKSIMKALESRIRGGRKEEPGRLLVPKEDDIAAIAVRRIRQ